MEPQAAEPASALAAFLPMVFIQLLSLFFIFPLSKRVDVNKWVTTGFMCVPVLGFSYLYYFGYRVLKAVFDRLDEIMDRLPEKPT